MRMMTVCVCVLGGRENVVGDEGKENGENDKICLYFDWLRGVM